MGQRCSSVSNWPGSQTSMKFLLVVALIYLPNCYGYPDVRIENSTPWKVEYNIRYRSFFCGDDKGQELEADEVGIHPRGACLITSIEVTVFDDRFYILYDCDYQSSGTSYSRFEIEPLARGGCKVTRL